MREAAPSDFPVEVEGQGTFIFGRRTGRDRFRIAALYHRLTEGLDVSGSDFGVASEAFATVSTLLVEGPASFVALLDLDAPADTDDRDALILRVFFALRHKELSFRPGAKQDGQAAGQGDGADAGVLGPA